jgi:hypothetical protein
MNNENACYQQTVSHIYGDHNEAESTAIDHRLAKLQEER